MPILPEWEMRMMIGGNTKNYTFEEYESMLDSGTWRGGYVNGIYAGTYNPSYSISGITGSAGPTGNHAVAPVDTGIITGINPIDWNGGGTSGGGGSSNEKILLNKTALNKTGFVGYNTNDKSGCLRRCQEMLAKVNTSLNGIRVGMVNIKDGAITGKSSSFQQGVNEINNSLLQGKPVIVGVDYKPGSPNSDGVTDHFIVIVGVSQTVAPNGTIQTSYQFFDPATQSITNGTSSDNILTVNSNG